MPYCTAADVRAVLDPAGEGMSATSAAVLTDAQLSVAIEEAQAEVDGRLASRYSTQLPLATPPLLVKNVTRDIAAYLATLTYREGDPLPQGHPVLLRWQRANTMLQQIANGTIPIPVGDGTDIPEDATANPGESVQNPYDGDLLDPRDLGIYERTDGRWSIDTFAPRWPF